MSFIDDLRKAPKEHQKRIEIKKYKMLRRFCIYFYKIFKEECLYEAKHGGETYQSNLSYFLDEILSSCFNECKSRFVDLLNEKDSILFKKILIKKLKRDGFINYAVEKVPYEIYKDGRLIYKYDIKVKVQW